MKQLHRRLTLIFIFLSTQLLLFGAVNQDNYLPVQAQEGDGVWKLLRRYQLLDYKCNLSKFYEINNLKSGQEIFKGKTYLLPILIYKYDGKSIRTTIGISDWDQAVRIQKYNNSLVAKEVRAESYPKSRILWVPHHELHCPNEVKQWLKEQANQPNETAVASLKSTTLTREATKVEPKKVPLNKQETPVGSNLSNTASKRGNFPIFGKYASTPSVSTKLKGKVYYIVSGHGGPDPGAFGYRAKNRLCEDEYAYDVALRLCRNLIMHGATAYMIVRDPNDGIRDAKYLKCDHDELVWGNHPIPRSQKTRLKQRSDIINDLYKKNKWKGVTEQTVVVIHVDSRANQQIDVFFYHHPKDAKGRMVAKKLQQTMRSKYRREYHGTVTGRDLHMLREVEPTAVYVELGNIKHDRDQQRLVLVRNRELIADWLLAGLMK
ncbi:MAG: N-acetylmuramoyl-L-alanine amidase [Bacteroidota bacterium]